MRGSRSLTDRQALDALQRLLRAPSRRPSVAFLRAVIDIVAATGRSLIHEPGCRGCGLPPMQGRPVACSCTGCDGDGWRFPAQYVKDATRDWIEWCDECRSFPSIAEAAKAFATQHHLRVGWAVPSGDVDPHPYVADEGER